MSAAPLKIRAAVFDFDGVILESADIKTEALLELFSEWPEHLDKIRSHHLRNLGISRFKKFTWIYENLLGKELLDEERDRLGHEFSALVFQRVMECPFVPGALQALESLRGSCYLFVASGTPEDELREIVARRSLAELFNQVCGSPRHKVEILRSLASQYDLRFSEMVFVGDGRSDYDAAEIAGVPFIARATDGMSQTWSTLGVPQLPDLEGLTALLDPAPPSP